jgi:hypothetical protein
MPASHLHIDAIGNQQAEFSQLSSREGHAGFGAFLKHQTRCNKSSPTQIKLNWGNGIKLPGFKPRQSHRPLFKKANKAP